MDQLETLRNHIAAHGSDCSARLDAYLLGLTTSGLTKLLGALASWSHVNDVAIVNTTPAEVRKFVQAQALSGRSGKSIKPVTIRIMLRSISDLHVKVLEVVDPVTHMLVSSELKAIFREKGSRGRAIHPLRLKGDVRDIAIDDPLPGSILSMLRSMKGDDSPWALRTRVILGVGADTGRPRRDYARLRVGDLIEDPDGSGVISFGRMPSGRHVEEPGRYVSPETVGFIRDWTGWREKTSPGSVGMDAPLLVRIDQKGRPGQGITVNGYDEVLKEISRRIGDGAPISGNSFHAGLKLDLAAIGTTKVGIANALGHRELS
jgi:integrase